jgi:hypothetical protein
MKQFDPTTRTRLRQRPDRGHYDAETIHAILDEGLVAHVAFEMDGQPHVLPMAYGRAGDEIFIHGARTSRIIRTLSEGLPVCVNVILLDGLVLARSAFHTSMNFRSVSIYGTPAPLTKETDKLRAMRALIDHVAPERYDSLRPVNAKELAQTGILSISLSESVAKCRDGGPIDDEEDMEIPVWAGVVPLSLNAAPPLADKDLQASVPLPENVARYTRS